MLSKRKLAVILPMLFELAMSYDYYYPNDAIPLEHRQTNHWGKEGPAEEERDVKVGSIGGGYYGRTVPGLREEETGNAKEREFGSKHQSYPYKLEPARILSKETLIPLSPEARLRMMREPFREHIYNITGQVPTLEETKKMKVQFMDFVKKELNLTNFEAKKLFGTETSKKGDGKLPGYLLFDDMDKFDFDPEEALKYMPRLPANPTKEQIDQAYSKAWEMLGKSNSNLRKVYKEYRRKYLENNPLGPVLTEKEFLKFSIKLREREAAKLGFVSADPNADPISKSIEVSIFLRDALKEEYEKYKSQKPNDRFSSAKNFVSEALFTDNLILDDLDDQRSSSFPETLPSPYDPIQGRSWTDTISGSSILNVTEASDKLINGEAVYDNQGNLIFGSDQYLSDQEDAYSNQSLDNISQEYGANDNNSQPGGLNEEGSGSGSGSGSDSADSRISHHKLSRVSKYNNVKSPSQLLFERSVYSTSAQKRVIDRIDDFTLINVNDLSASQLLKLHNLIYYNLSTDAERKEEEKYFQQRLGEQGGDIGTNTEVYREFLFNKFGNGLFFIPKRINSNKDTTNTILPVSATGFEIVKNEDGLAKIKHIATDLSFNIDYSGEESFYVNGYLGNLKGKQLVSRNINNFISPGWKLTDSQVPSPYRFISDIDNKVSKLNTFESSLSLYKDNLNSSDTVQGKVMAGKVSEHLARNAQLLKKYEESRNRYIRSQEKLMDELNKFKSIFRSRAVFESMNKISNSLTGETVKGVDVSKFSEELNKGKLTAFLKERDELNVITNEEFVKHMNAINDLKTECESDFIQLEDSCNELVSESSRINSEILSMEDEVSVKFFKTLDKKQSVGAQILDELNNLDLVNNNLIKNVELILPGKLNDFGIKAFTETPEASSLLETEVMDIFRGNKKAADYKKLIDVNSSTTKYYVEEVKESTDDDSDKEEDDDSKEVGKKSSAESKDSKESVTKYSTDFKGKVKLVFDEALTIIEDHVRDLYISVTDRKERMSELLKLEAFLIRELLRHRSSLSVVINRVVLPEDEIIDESETDELKMRILLKIHEEKTKLMYVREVLDKLYFYPHFRGIRPSFTRKLRKLEEDGIKSKFGFTYTPMFRLDEDERPVGIYGFKRLDYYGLREEFFNRLISGFEQDIGSYRFDLEIVTLLESLNYKELNSLLYSDRYIESSIFSKRTMLIKVLKKIINKEKDSELRRALKRAYFTVKDWLQGAIQFEKDSYGSSALESIISESKSSESSNNSFDQAIKLSSEKKGSDSKSSGKQHGRIRRNN